MIGVSIMVESFRESLRTHLPRKPSARTCTSRRLVQASAAPSAAWSLRFCV